VTKAQSGVLAASRYLRAHDMVGGYLPALAMPIEAATAWMQLWAEVRSHDDASESGQLPARPPLLGSLVRRRRPELGPTLDRFATWTSVEAARFTDWRVRTIPEYFDLLEARAFCPVYICAVLALPGEDRDLLEAFAASVGFGAQLMDDTLDLVADISRGVLFITAEEFEHLALSPADLGTERGLRAVTRLRNRWALTYYLTAYRLTSEMQLDNNRRLARAWLELGLRALVDDRIRPLDPRILADQGRYLRHFGIHTVLFDLPAPSESCRLRLNRMFVRRLVSNYSVLAIVQAAAKAVELGPELPSRFMVWRLGGRPLRPPRSTADATDGRRPVSSVHYGDGGLLPFAVDAARIFLRR
jgi:hypothetical protein